MKHVFILCLFGLLSSCGHNVTYRASHFAIPYVPEVQWKGHIGAGLTSLSRISIIDDITTNPPARGPLEYNRSSFGENIADSVGISYITLDGAITVLPRLELFSFGSFYGARWQVVGDKGTAIQSDSFMLALHGAFGSKNFNYTTGSSLTESKVDSDSSSTQIGLSIGKNVSADLTPYFSYIKESHSVKSVVRNTHGVFNFQDNGDHDYFTLGLLYMNSQALMAAEVSQVLLNWNRAAQSSYIQTTVGLKIGITW